MFRRAASCAACSVSTAWAIRLEKPPLSPRFVTVRKGAVSASSAASVMRVSSSGRSSPFSVSRREKGQRKLSEGRVSRSTAPATPG